MNTKQFLTTVAVAAAVGVAAAAVYQAVSSSDDDIDLDDVEINYEDGFASAIAEAGFSVLDGLSEASTEWGEW